MDRTYFVSDKQQYEKRGYLNEEYRLFYLEDLVAKEVTYHYHDFDKILIFYKGNITYTIEGKAYSLLPQDIILVPQGDSHKVESIDHSEYFRLVIYLSPQYLSGIEENGISLRDCFLRVKERYSNVVRIREKGENSFMQIAEQMRSIIQNNFTQNRKQDFADLYLSTLLVQFLISLNRKMADESVYFVDTTHCNPKMTEIIRYINTHLSEEISIDSLACRFYISKYHMMRQFKEETGYTIGNYINQKRLLAARELLKQGESVTKAYLDCGYKDYSTFVRAYKQLFGELPSKH